MCAFATESLPLWLASCPCPSPPCYRSPLNLPFPIPPQTYQHLQSLPEFLPHVLCFMLLAWQHVMYTWFSCDHKRSCTVRTLVVAAHGHDRIGASDWLVLQHEAFVPRATRFSFLLMILLTCKSGWGSHIRMGQVDFSVPCDWILGLLWLHVKPPLATFNCFGLWISWLCVCVFKMGTSEYMPFILDIPPFLIPQIISAKVGNILNKIQNRDLFFSNGVLLGPICRTM